MDVLVIARDEEFIASDVAAGGHGDVGGVFLKVKSFTCFEEFYEFQVLRGNKLLYSDAYSNPHFYVYVYTSSLL